LSKKAIVSLLILSMIAVACATEEEAVEEVAVEEEHDHSDESTLDEVKEICTTNFDIDFSNAKKVIFIKDKLINIVQ